MKIVHIIDFFHPNAGYQVNVLSKYFVKLGNEVVVITSQLDKIEPDLLDFFGKDNIEQSDINFSDLTNVKIVRVPIWVYYSGRSIYTSKLKKVLESENPDIVFIHDIDTFAGINAVLRIKSSKWPIVFNSTMLEMASRNVFAKQFRHFFRTFITPKIIKNNLVTIRIQNDDYLERCLGIPLNLCPFISVGSDTLLFEPNSVVRSKFRFQLDIHENDFVFIYTGKLIESKGGLFLAKAFEKKIINNQEKNVVLLIVGNTSNDEYGDNVNLILNRSENRIIRFPTQKYLDLAKFYQIADVSLFPKECSLSFYDAQACGLPVLSEDNNVNIDRLKYNNGLTFVSNNVDSLLKRIVEFVEMEEKKMHQMSQESRQYVVKNFNYEDIAKMYLKILTEEYIRFNNRRFDNKNEKKL